MKLSATNAFNCIVFMVKFGHTSCEDIPPALNNILLLITRSGLSITQANSCFKRLDTRTFTYATPTFITEALRLVTLVHLLLTIFTVN